MRIVRILVLFCLVAMVSGCGQKGPLVLPDAQHPHKKAKFPAPPKAPAPAKAPAPPPPAPPAPAGPAPNAAPPATTPESNSNADLNIAKPEL